MHKRAKICILKQMRENNRMEERGNMKERNTLWQNDIKEELAATLIGTVQENYGDIIDMPHPVSKKHPPMSEEDRAAQFSPFAALTGHEAAIQETARHTDRRIELDEDSRELLDRTFQEVLKDIGEKPLVTVTYFQPDGRKEGGNYITVQGCVQKYKEYEQVVVLEDDIEIAMQDIVALVRC